MVLISVLLCNLRFALLLFFFFESPWLRIQSYKGLIFLVNIDLPYESMHALLIYMPLLL